MRRDRGLLVCVGLYFVFKRERGDGRGKNVDGRCGFIFPEEGTRDERGKREECRVATHTQKK